jgi:hypothetical protein
MTELEELKLAYAECSRQRNELLVKFKHRAQPAPVQDVSLIDEGKTAAQPALVQPVAWMSNKDFEPIRSRIMSEAYELAERDAEGYNAIKVMCGDVQKMLPAQPAVPDEITDRSESPEYIQGWNDCRALMLEMARKL